MTSLRRLLPFVRPYRWIVIALIVTVILPVAMELVVPRMLQVVIDQGIRAGDMATIWRGSLVMLVAALIGALATLGQGYCRAWLSQGLAFDLRNALFAHVQSLSFANLDHLQTGQLMTRLSSDVDLVRSFSGHGSSLILRAVLMIAGSLVMLFLTNARLALVMLGLLPLAALIIAWIIRKAQPLFLDVQQKLAALNTIVQENLAGVQVVKAFVRERFEIKRFGERNLNYMGQQIRVGRLLAISLPALTVLTNVGLVAVVWWGGLDVLGARLTLGELVAFTNYLLIGMAPLLMLSNMLTGVSQAEASAQRVLELLETQPEIQPSADPYQAPMIGQVTFDAVSFHYDGDGGRPVLQETTFHIEPGQQVALLGATGSGKSTLVNLIPRFYDVNAGSIRVDDVDVRQWAPANLRAQIGIVLQESTLFSGTVRENIAYGRVDAPLEEVVAAAQAAQAHDFIMAMPAGYDSIVEARGANLSGGQKQRIAIARALLIGPRILILDDSTSAVDLETEAQIQQALDGLMAGRTIFVIAQRIHSILHADLILVLDRGRIVDQGSHRELLERSAIYREIYESQLGRGDAKTRGPGSPVQRIGEGGMHNLRPGIEAL